MIDELKRIVKNTSEEEAKSLLLLTLSCMDLHDETAGYSDSDLSEDVKKTYQDFLDTKRNQAAIQHRDYKVYHILFGDSSAGGVKMALKEVEMNEDEKVLIFSDLFSIGPVGNLDEEEGIQQRLEWLENHLIEEDDFSQEYQHAFHTTLSEISAIPHDVPITIWAGENAHEQMGLRLVMSLLKGKSNSIIVINSSEIHRSLFATSKTRYNLLHTGELSIEQLKMILKESKKLLPLSPNDRTRLEKEYAELSSTKEVLRIWQNHFIKSVKEDYYDDYIIATANTLLNKRSSDKFLKSARLIGELIGHLEQYVSDQFFEYRVRQLIYGGVFEIKGVPKGMRFYSIRFKQVKGMSHKESSLTERAVSFLKLIISNKVQEAFQKHAAPELFHHNPYFPGDAHSLMSAMEENAEDSPEKILTVKHTIEEGNLVVVHSHIKQNIEDVGAAVVHIFRFKEGRIVELWDIGQSVPEDSPNENGVF
ncbi:MAG: DUF1835 domain-containing protein [Bacillota bacterium]